MEIEHPDLGLVPTYGGPYDSYTIPEQDDDGSFYCYRFDHDEGCWTDGTEHVGEVSEIAKGLLNDKLQQAQELATLRQRLADAKQEQERLLAEQFNQCDTCIRNPIEFSDAIGSIYEIYYDNGDREVGIPPGYVCDEEFSTPEMVEQAIKDATAELQSQVAVMREALETAKKHWIKYSENTDCDVASCGRCYGCGQQGLGHLIYNIEQALSSTPSPRTQQIVDENIKFYILQEVANAASAVMDVLGRGNDSVEPGDVYYEALRVALDNAGWDEAKETDKIRQIIKAAREVIADAYFAQDSETAEPYYIVSVKAHDKLKSAVEDDSDAK